MSDTGQRKIALHNHLIATTTGGEEECGAKENGKHRQTHGGIPSETMTGIIEL